MYITVGVWGQHGASRRTLMGVDSILPYFLKEGGGGMPRKTLQLQFECLLFVLLE